MSKVIQVVVYKSVSHPEKLAAYAALARPAMAKAGGFKYTSIQQVVDIVSILSNSQTKMGADFL